MKKCALISDLSGFGKCSLSVQITMLSVMGIEAHPLPTAIFSNQSEYPSYEYVDLSAYMDKFIDEWKKMDVHFDGVLTGYYTDESQVDNTLRLVDSNTVLLVDPVMASNGKTYDRFSNSLCKKISQLAFKADIVTPNKTELQIITGEEDINKGAQYLLSNGAKSVIVTGIRENDKIKNAIFSNGLQETIESKCYGGKFSGTGDIFSSLIMGYYLNGHDIFTSVHLASNFVEMCTKNTLPRRENDGVDFEESLQYLKGIS